MKTSLLCLLTISALLACSQNPENSADGPAARLRRWHAAFLAGDMAQVRELLSLESRKHMASLPKSTPRKSEPLQILSQQRDGSRVDIEVMDPSPNAVVAKGTFVMVKEEGEWRLDLVKTAGANSREVALPGAPVRLRKLPMTPAQERDLRRRAAAMYQQRKWAEAQARKRASGRRAKSPGAFR